MDQNVHMFNLETTERITAEHTSSFLRSQSPLHLPVHLQSSVHTSLADRHLQFPLHPFLQEQEISSEHDFEASCRCDQTGM